MPGESSVASLLGCLLSTETFDDAFDAFASIVMDTLGYEGVLYGCAPAIFGSDPLFKSPVVRAKGLYSTELLMRYHEEGLADHDFTVKAIMQGVTGEMDWWLYRHRNLLSSQEITLLDIAKSFGLHNGLSIPAMNNKSGFAGISVASAKDREHFDQLNRVNLQHLKDCMHVFNAFAWTHHADSIYQQFVGPVLMQLTKDEKRYLRELPSGKKVVEVAAALNKAPKTMENISRRARAKFNNANTAQLIYYSGLLRFNDYL